MDGKKVYAKAISKNPETYFTPEVMEKLDEIAKEEFLTVHDYSVIEDWTAIRE